MFALATRTDGRTVRARIGVGGSRRLRPDFPEVYAGRTERDHTLLVSAVNHPLVLAEEDL